MRMPSLNGCANTARSKPLVAAHQHGNVGIVLDLRQKLRFESLQRYWSVVEERTRLRYGDGVGLVVLVGQRIRLGSRKHDGDALLERGYGEDERHEQKERKVDEGVHVDGGLRPFAAPSA